MSQGIKLIRSAVSGKKPDRYNINVGELALNTTDGIFYFKRGDDTVQSLFSTNTVIEGNLLLKGNTFLTGSTQFSGSFFTIGPSSFSGSVNISSSLNVLGPSYFTGSVNITGSTNVVGPINLQPTTAPTFGIYSASIYVSSSGNDLWIADHSSSFDFTSISSTLKSGILRGGVVSTGSSNTVFNVTSGSGQIVDINKNGMGLYGKPHPLIKYIKWDTFTDQSLTYLTSADTTWLLIDSNGNLVQQPVTFTDEQYKTHIIIGAVIHPSRTSIALTKTFPVTSYGTANQFEDFVRIFGPIKIEGYGLSASGSSLSVNRTAGKAFSLGRNYLNDAESPNIVNDVSKDKCLFYRYYRSGSGFKTDNNAGAGYDVVDPTLYDNGTGILTSVPGGQYTIQRIFYFPGQTDLLGIYYGRATYNSLAVAEDSINEESFSEIDNTKYQAIFVGYLIVKAGATDLSNTNDAKFIPAGLFRSTGTGGGGGGGAANSLDDLTDVTLTSVSSGDLLVYTGADWENTKQLNGNYQVTGSFSISGSINVTGEIINSPDSTSILNGNTTSIKTIDGSGIEAAFFDYIIKTNDGNHKRAGGAIIMWKVADTLVEFTEYSTLDIGDTSNIIIGATISGTDINVNVTNNSGQTILVKSTVRLL